MFGIIYCVTNTVSGKQYVGQTTYPLEVRWRYHLKSTREGSTCALHCAIRKYGAESFKFEQLDVADSADDLNEKEVYYVAQRGTLAPSGYNLTIGGEVGMVSEETRQKLSTVAIGHVASIETRRKQSLSLVGHAVSEETRQKLSRAAIGRKPSEDSRRKMSQAALGHAVSEETRKRISAAQVGKVVSEETRKKLSEAALYR